MSPWQMVVGPDAVIIALGVVFTVTVTGDDAAVHPFAAVTTTEYVPDAVTLIEDVIDPSLQR